MREFVSVFAGFVMGVLLLGIPLRERTDAFRTAYARGYAACADSVRANVGTARRLSATMRPDSAAITTDALGLRVDMTWRQP